MSDKNHKQKQYDPRLRELIQTTGDLDLATRHGVPRSTARGWLKQTKTDVVSIDVLDMDAEALQRQVLWLRRRLTRLLALLHLVVANPQAPVAVSEHFGHGGQCGEAGRVLR